VRPVATDGVAWSVGLSVGHDRESRKGGRNGRDAVRDFDLGGSKEPCIRWGSRSPVRRGNFERDDFGILPHAAERHSQWP